MNSRISLTWEEVIKRKQWQHLLSRHDHYVGIKATKELRDKDPVISVPLKYVMSVKFFTKRCAFLGGFTMRAVHRSRQSAHMIEDHTVRKALTSVRDDGDLVAIFIMRELALGEASKWAPYIKVQ